MRSIRPLSVAGGVVAALTGTVLAAAPASAATSGAVYKDTSGGAASCSFSTPNAYDAQINCTLWDTQRDGDAVYVAWQSGYGGWRSVYNRNGSGTSFPFSQVAYTDGARTWSWKVCRDRQAPWTDSCSGTFSWTRPPR